MLAVCLKGLEASCQQTSGCGCERASRLGSLEQEDSPQMEAAPFHELGDWAELNRQSKLSTNIHLSLLPGCG